MNSRYAGIMAMPAAMKQRTVGVIVSTPLQYLNALELVEELACRERYLAIQEAFYNLLDFADLPGFASWRRVEVVPAGTQLPEQRAGRYVRCLVDLLTDRQAHRRIGLMLEDWPPLELVVIGNPYEVIHQDFAAQSAADELLICDDGTASAVFDPAVNSRSRQLRKRMIGIRHDPLAHAWWYTAYPQGRRQHRLLLNTYSYLRAQVSRRYDSSRGADDIWFLGQPLVEFGVISATAYAELIRSIATNVYRGRRLRYLPHPREWPTCLGSLAAAAGIELAKRSGPVEIELIRCECPPARVGMLYSSAFQTCHTIFAGAVPFDVFEPDERQLKPCNGETRIMRDCYAYFRAHVRDPHRFFHQDAALDWAQAGTEQDDLLGENA
ncbi:hypothetical protein [Halomonas nitroreducens]|uniref:Glycosyltransferase family 1 protein n=1 Tax=Halomonas nitroreducens TaxID=447425 RepID=A0A3S0JYR4_9GAMM|nr:hypothetical protein [Halomonas nitroreducens]RTR05344.1 hypothetical protein EKG36_07100 [Halomonas nitroreducens]